MDLTELAKFLVKAKIKSYAGDGKELKPREYRDSYAGSYFAPGQEVVRFQRIPVWMMAYSGGMLPEYRDAIFTKHTISFLKKALLKIEESRPFRGPKKLILGNWKYIDSSEGDITDFKGIEKIFFKDEVVFRQNYIGGLVITKK